MILQNPSRKRLIKTLPKRYHKTFKTATYSDVVKFLDRVKKLRVEEGRNLITKATERKLTRYVSSIRRSIKTRKDKAKFVKKYVSRHKVSQNKAELRFYEARDKVRLRKKQAKIKRILRAKRVLEPYKEIKKRDITARSEPYRGRVGKLNQYFVKKGWSNKREYRGNILYSQTVKTPRIEVYNILMRPTYRYIYELDQHNPVFQTLFGNILEKQFSKFSVQAVVRVDRVDMDDGSTELVGYLRGTPFGFSSLKLFYNDLHKFVRGSVGSILARLPGYNYVFTLSELVFYGFVPK
jgi:hypothetical protein